ncbi:uncharacterized protein TRIVIDRAFT_83634 [Trichoderma virens Gv29-8]|uniref:Cell wall protein PhiA n=1 Tax=Hypocrea virens (strain Gv29-8 / FGSC 10586) TaxID=413071 RepID=G9MWU4_HYPVG|nr:uncharacterized protein TRIVIDRAFT_83634 [Trichoderma virens Gv29-8]EHK21077.1 hypothetical protein TRIVIDRAFT_83634 [Trichoderma virens Gv29-8]UKZ49147.1 hypothetical protein TrVGV298_003388 [Trichoderma virens]UKZ75675.1 hypothetical protein TrVFT333_003365 [Trichoderma virens FT-333]
MKFQIISAVSLLLSSVTAAPPPALRTFDVMALHSASPIHFAQMSAARSGLFLNLPQQNATCKGESSGHATFYIANEELVLYSCEGEKQKVFVDRSGMGQGIVGYITGSQSLPRYGESKGWRVDKDKNLFFKDAGLIACPHSIDGSWRIWLGLGFTAPGGNKDCLGMSARTLDNKTPISCHYT